MGMTPGFTEYRCSRKAGVHKDDKVPVEYLLDGDPGIKHWFWIDHIDQNNVPKRILVCEQCWEKYQSIRKTWDRDMQEFMEANS